VLKSFYYNDLYKFRLANRSFRPIVQRIQTLNLGFCPDFAENGKSQQKEVTMLFCKSSVIFRRAGTKCNSIGPVRQTFPMEYPRTQGAPPKINIF
jgi:hypothetical protein